MGITSWIPLKGTLLFWLIPLQSWGAANYHNAVILCREKDTGSGGVEVSGERGMKVRGYYR